MTEPQTSEKSSAPSGGGALAVLSGHTFVYLLGSLLAKLAAFITLPIFTRLLPTTAQWGVYSLASSTLDLMAQFVGVKLDTAMTRHYFDSTDEEQRKRVISTAFLGVSFLAIIFSGVLYFCADWLAGILLVEKSEEMPQALRVTSLILIAMLVTEIPLGVLKAQHRLIAATSWQILRLLLELTLKITLVVAYSMGVVGILMGQAAADILFVVGFSYWLIRRFGVAFDTRIMASMIRYSAPMVIAGICGFALHQVDRFMIPRLSSLSELGVYDPGYRIGSAMTSILLNPFLYIWYPFIFGKNDPQERGIVISNAAVYIPAIVVALSLPVTLLAPEIVMLLTDPKYHGGWVYVPVVAFAYVFWGLFQVVQTPFYVQKKTTQLPRLVGSSTVVNAVLNVELIPVFGAMGAAIATLVTFVYITFVGRFMAQEMERVPVAWGRLLRLLLVFAGACALIYLMPPGSLASLLTRIAAIFLLLAYLALIFVTTEERRQVFVLLRSIRKKS